MMASVKLATGVILYKQNNWSCKSFNGKERETTMISGRMKFCHLSRPLQLVETNAHGLKVPVDSTIG